MGNIELKNIENYTSFYTKQDTQPNYNQKINNYHEFITFMTEKYQGDLEEKNIAK